MASIHRWLLVTTLSAFAATSRAQFGRLELEPQPTHGCSAHVSGATVIPEGKDGNNFERGWGVSAGGEFELSPPQDPPSPRPVLFLGVEYLFARSNATPPAAMSVDTSSSPHTVRGDFSVLSLEPEIRFYLSHRMMGYFSGGFGWFRRGVIVEDVSNPTVLNPGGGASQTVVTNSGEVDGGIGIQVAPRQRGGPAFFVEGRAKKALAINHNLIFSPDLSRRALVNGRRGNEGY